MPVKPNVCHSKVVTALHLTPSLWFSAQMGGCCQKTFLQQLFLLLGKFPSNFPGLGVGVLSVISNWANFSAFSHFSGDTDISTKVQFCKALRPLELLGSSSSCQCPNNSLFYAQIKIHLLMLPMSFWGLQETTVNPIACYSRADQ